MSRDAKVTLPFDEAREFRLGIGELEELQERCDAGPEELFNRLASDRWRVADIQQTLRLGLIGAGLKPIKAAVLVERYAGPAYLLDYRSHARAILFAAMAGAPDEDETSSGEAAGETTSSPEANSASEGSTPEAH